MIQKIKTLRLALVSMIQSAQLLREIRVGIENLSNLIIERFDKQSHLINERFDELRSAIALQSPAVLNANDISTGAPRVRPIEEIKYPVVRFGFGLEFVKEVIDSDEFHECIRFFADNPASARSLVSPHSQALIFTIVRGSAPEHVFEIGTFKAGTTEAICRALVANNRGTVHTVDPYGSPLVPRIVSQWPEPLRKHVKFYPLNSMEFYTRMLTQHARPDVVFVDGNHDVEFASFDIECASRLLTPSGFIFVDNISQPGPFLATKRFIERNSAWHGIVGDIQIAKAYDRERTRIPNTDMALLRAPQNIIVDTVPISTGQSPWAGTQIGGIAIDIHGLASGTLYVQCVLRCFGDSLEEHVVERTIELRGATGSLAIEFDCPIPSKEDFTRFTVEPWLTWVGRERLSLERPPRVY